MNLVVVVSLLGALGLVAATGIVAWALHAKRASAPPGRRRDGDAAAAIAGASVAASGCAGGASVAASACAGGAATSCH